MGIAEIFTVTGRGVAPYLDEVARLRIQVFAEFPYLYDGNMEYERNYLDTYAKSPESLFVLAADGSRIVGASTAVPLADETEEFKRPFAASGYDPSKIFYYGESVLDSRYRGQGIGVRFFTEREAYARNLGRFDWCAFCAVDRSPDHPKKPSDYVFLDKFWVKRGFTKHPELKTEYLWKELGEAAPTPKAMTYWLKRLG